MTVADHGRVGFSAAQQGKPIDEQRFSRSRFTGDDIQATRQADADVLGNGEISVKVTVEAHAFSSSAEEKISAAGGSAKKL